MKPHCKLKLKGKTETLYIGINLMGDPFDFQEDPFAKIAERAFRQFLGIQNRSKKFFIIVIRQAISLAKSLT
jgi:hypothetical protein